MSGSLLIHLNSLGKTDIMAEQKKRSYIVGQAEVVFGGGIAISAGTIGGDPNTMAIGLAELKNPVPDAGCEIDEDAETFGIQVGLIFPDLHSLEHFRGVLNELEVRLKERMSEKKEGDQ